ncbi:MAG TPA: hypothetical protein DD381_10340 [Lentisphaeria bacterium]|nr:MAG: hypothetical protein A2X47_13875 [Lentisphaerae bacterium GWF2_38_69]HBM16724.1 hypothetical protein [Lentisphaeria bacterium]
MIQTIILLVCGSLVFPLFYIYPFTYYKTVQYFFNLPSISALCLAFIFINPRRLLDNLKNSRILLILSLLFLIVPVVHLFMFDTITIPEFFFSILWITIPFFAYLYSDKLEKALPVYFFIFLLFDISVSLIQSDEIVGIAGNRNWHAATLAIIMPFTFYLAVILYKKWSAKFNKFLLISIFSIVLAITTFASLYIIILCRTRTIFALFPALIVIALFLEFRKKYIKSSIAILAVAFIALAGFLIISTYHPEDTSDNSNALSIIQNKENSFKDKLAETVDRDVRIPLWKGCIDLISTHPYLGVSAPRFESEFQLYRPIDYFTKPDNAVRSNHPHNSILYMAAAYGIPGMLIWLIIWALPMIMCLIRYYKLSGYAKIALFAYILLFIHGLMDLIFFEWPTVFFSALLAGILWAQILRKKQLPTEIKIISPKKNANSAKVIKPLIPKYISYPMIIVSIILIVITGLMVFFDTMSSYYFRLGEYAEVDGYKLQAAQYYGKGVEYEKNTQYVYKAGTIYLQDLNNTSKALYYLDMFNTMSVSNYAHSNGFIALGLVKEGKLKEALPYLLKEVVVYPLLVGSWYRLTYVQGSLGLKKDAEISFNNMMEALKYKNLTPNKRTIYFLLDNPTYDAHPDRIPPETLKQLNAE